VNLDLAQIFRDYQLLTKEVVDKEEAAVFLKEEFDIDSEEVVALWYNFFDLIANKIELKKQNKKELERIDAFIALMYDAFFFGMYFSKNYT
jgi:hypothetical protein